VTIADSGRMYTILNDQYLKLELYNGYNYNEGSAQTNEMAGRGTETNTLSKTKFDKTQIVFDLSSFGLNRTDKKWFQGNRIMRNLSELQHDMDSIGNTVKDQDLGLLTVTSNSAFQFHFKNDTIPLPDDLAAYKAQKDSIAEANTETKLAARQKRWTATAARSKSLVPEIKTDNDSLKALVAARSDSLFTLPPTSQEVAAALAHARLIKSQITNFGNQKLNFENEYRVFQVQWHKILSQSLACIVMFLIGAPLGAIIKRGGLGVPVLASILFFIIFYILTMLGEKWSKQGLIPVPVGIWAANGILFVVGLLFLRQARVDARLFDADFYNVVWDKLKAWLRSKKLLPQVQA